MWNMMIVELLGTWKCHAMEDHWSRACAAEFNAKYVLLSWQYNMFENRYPWQIFTCYWRLLTIFWTFYSSHMGLKYWLSPVIFTLVVDQALTYSKGKKRITRSAWNVKSVSLSSGATWPTSHFSFYLQFPAYSIICFLWT